MAGSEQSPPRRKIGAMRLLITTGILLVLGITWALFVAGSLRAMEVQSRSMEPTLQLKDRLVVGPIERSDLQRGALVILLPPDDDGPEMVKRIVGIPGDTVGLRDGVFFVNGEPSPPPGSPTFRYEGLRNFSYELKEGEYYLLGDHRARSHDSIEFGPVPERLITGKVVYRYSPRSRMGSVK